MTYVAVLRSGDLVTRNDSRDVLVHVPLEWTLFACVALDRERRRLRAGGGTGRLLRYKIHTHRGLWSFPIIARVSYAKSPESVPSPFSRSRATETSGRRRMGRGGLVGGPRTRVVGPPEGREGELL